MHRPAVPDAYIEEVAERTDFAVDDVRIGLRVLHDAVRDRIVEQYRRARDDSTPNHLLTDDAGSAWFAFAFADLRSELEAAGYEMDADLLAAVAAVNMTVFQEVHDYTVSFPRDLADASDTPFFYPVYVEKPEWWREAETRTLRSLIGLLESGSSPAAALDAWAVNAAGADPDEWAAVRGVDPERVRVNAEKAPDPAPEAAPGLRAEARDGVPDGPYDPETDRLFVPTTDQLAAAREASEEAASDDERPTADEPPHDDERGKHAGGDEAAQTSEGSTNGPGTAASADPDPDRLAEIDPEDLLSGGVEAADLPEYAVQGADPDEAPADPAQDLDPAQDRDVTPDSETASDPETPSASRAEEESDDEGRFIDGAAAFDRDADADDR